MPTITGNFYLKRTEQGGLKGEYSNNRSTRPMEENAERTGVGETGNIGGIYDTVWIEEPNEPLSAVLTIKQRAATERLFELTWTRGEQNNHRAIFQGSAMLVGDNLIGNYWSVQ